MSFEVSAEGVNVEELMSAIRRRIEEKRRGLYTDEEVREIAEHRLDAVLDAHEFNSDFVAEFRAREGRWNFQFGAETLYRSSRGTFGQLLERARRLLRPVQKLFWNPNPMISALSRQAELNKYYVHMLGALAAEVTKLNLELQDLKSRQLQLQGRHELLQRREKTLEDMVVYREEPAPEPKQG